MSKREIPNRTVQPENVKYVLLTKSDFVDSITNFSASITAVVNKKQKIRIYTPGFDGFFKSAEDLTETLTDTEWRSIRYIKVEFEDDEKYKYTPRLSLKFGVLAGLDAGLSIDFGSGNTDIERLAIKEKINIFLKDFARKPIMSNRIVSLLVTGFVIAVFNLLLIPNLSERTFETLGLIGLISVINGWWIYTLLKFVYARLIPSFEAVTVREDTRIKKLGSLFRNLMFIVGGVSAVIGIVQWIMS